MLGFLGGVGSVISGMDGAGGPGGMDLDLSSRADSRAVSEAVSGGTFSSGDIGTGKSNALVIGAVVVLGLLILFWRKK